MNALHATDSNARPRKHTDTRERERVKERDEEKEGELNASITMEIFRDVEKERRQQMRGKDSRSARHVCRELPPVELIMELCTHGRSEHRSGRGFAWVGEVSSWIIARACAFTYRLTISFYFFYFLLNTQISNQIVPLTPAYA